jgi:hypothetical protein
VALLLAVAGRLQGFCMSVHSIADRDICWQPWLPVGFSCAISNGLWLLTLDLVGNGTLRELV